MGEENLLQTSKFQFPTSHIHKPHESIPELQKPITITVDDIKQDMNSFVKKFPKESIPHITETNEICDNIHNFRQVKMPSIKSHQTTTSDFSQYGRKTLPNTGDLP